MLVSSLTLCSFCLPRLMLSKPACLLSHKHISLLSFPSSFQCRVGRGTIRPAHRANGPSSSIITPNGPTWVSLSTPCPSSPLSAGPQLPRRLTWDLCLSTAGNVSTLLSSLCSPIIFQWLHCVAVAHIECSSLFIVSMHLFYFVHFCTLSFFIKGLFGLLWNKVMFVKNITIFLNSLYFYAVILQINLTPIPLSFSTLTAAFTTAAYLISVTLPAVTVASFYLRAFYSKASGEMTGNCPLTVALGGIGMSSLLSSALWSSIITCHTDSPLWLQTHHSLLPFCTATYTHRHPPTHYVRNRVRRRHIHIHSAALLL